MAKNRLDEERKGLARKQTLKKRIHDLNSSR